MASACEIIDSGEDALWCPKSVFPRTPFRERRIRVIIWVWCGDSFFRQRNTRVIRENVMFPKGAVPCVEDRHCAIMTAAERNARRIGGLKR